MNVISPIAADMRGVLDAQRQEAFLRAGPPSLQERRADLKKLADAIGRGGERIAEVISADFGNRSRHETILAEIFTTLSGIRHASRHLAKWMRPKRVSVGIEFMPARARILYQPVGVVGIISPWNYPFQLAMMPLVAALAAGNRVMLKPSELTPRTSMLMAELLSDLFPRGEGGDRARRRRDRRGFRASAVRSSALHRFDRGRAAGHAGGGREFDAGDARARRQVALHHRRRCGAVERRREHRPRQAVECRPDLHRARLRPLGAEGRRREEFINLAGQARKLYPTSRQSRLHPIVNDRHYRRIAQYVQEARAKGRAWVELNPAQEALPAASASWRRRWSSIPATI